jgi:hypothetical protein
MNTIDEAFVKKVEAAHFRTVHDTGANENALLIWNIVREHVGLPWLKKSDLPVYCETHDTYHLFRDGYGCKPRTESVQ